MNLSVVIPSIGRESLVSLCNDIIVDAGVTGIDVHIFIALNGTLPSDFAQIRGVTILEVSRVPCGVSRAVNEAMMVVPEGWVWTIADDESWLPGKFRNDLQELSAQSLETLLLPSLYYVDFVNVSPIVRPRRYPRAEEKIDHYLYGKPSFGRNTRYVSLSGSVAPRSVWLRFPFREVAVREDIEFLIAAQRGGVSLVFSRIPTVQVDAKHLRGLTRDPAQEAFGWCQAHLSGWSQVWFIASIWTKPFVWFGVPNEIREMKEVSAQGRGMSSPKRLVTALLLTVALLAANIRRFAGTARIEMGQ